MVERMEAVKLTIIYAFDRRYDLFSKVMRITGNLITDAVWTISDHYDELVPVLIVRMRAALLKGRRAAPLIAGILAVLVLTIVPANAIYQLSLYNGDSEVSAPAETVNTVSYTEGNEERFAYIAAMMNSPGTPSLRSSGSERIPDSGGEPPQPYGLIALTDQHDDTQDDDIKDDLNTGLINNEEPDNDIPDEPPADPTASTGEFIWPAEGRVVSFFGPRNIRLGSRNHKGIDIDAPNRAPIYAADGGEVIDSRYSESFGHVIKILHDNGHVTLYAHCNTRLVSIGERVEQGQLIARVGMTGIATGYHLHFELHINGREVDPIPYLPFEPEEDEPEFDFTEIIEMIEMNEGGFGRTRPFLFEIFVL